MERRKRDGQRLCRRYLGCDRSLALEFALVPVKGLLSAVLEVGAIMVLRQAMLAWNEHRVQSESDHTYRSAKLEATMWALSHHAQSG